MFIKRRAACFANHVTLFPNFDVCYIVFYILVSDLKACLRSTFSGDHVGFKLSSFSKLSVQDYYICCIYIGYWYS